MSVLQDASTIMEVGQVRRFQAPGISVLNSISGVGFHVCVVSG